MTDAAVVDIPRGAEGLALPRERDRERSRALRHTRRVRRLRIVLPSLGFVMLGVLVMTAALPKLFPLSALAGLSLSADGLVMNEPRLAGHLGEGRRYQVMADRAIQSLINPSRLSLEGLFAELDMGDGASVSITGESAAYDTDTEILTLADGVSITSTDGNEVSLSAATVRLRDGRVDSDGAIEIVSPRGHIRAGAISVTEGGAFIRLSQGVSITIAPAL
ncbi:MAG: LPS export ABC transporter periplasmic protein LptC [Pseudomonadota bacterium]